MSRVGDIVCARAYLGHVGCVDAARGTLLWSKPAIGADGLGGDDRFVYGTEDNGNVMRLAPHRRRARLAAPTASSTAR